MRGKDSLPLPPDTEPLLAGKESKTGYGLVNTKESDAEQSGLSNGTVRSDDITIVSDSGNDNIPSLHIEYTFRLIGSCSLLFSLMTILF